MFALGDLVAGSRQIKFDANVENIGLALSDSFTDRFEIALDRQRHGTGQHLDDDEDVRRRPRPGLECIAAVDGADLYRRQHELVRVFALVFFLPVLNRLGDFAGGEHELRRLAVDAHPRPEQTGVADLQLQPGGLADDAHIRHHAMVHQIARADAGAAILFAVEI